MNSEELKAKALDFIKCGIAANYSGDRRDELMQLIYSPTCAIFDELAAVKAERDNLKKLHDAEISLAELRQETIYSLRACIETAEKQEPDSWRVTSHRCCGTHTTDKEIAEHWMKTGEAYPLYAMPPMPAQQKTYTVKVYNKGGSGEFKRVEGIDALEDGQKLIAIKE